jgi:tetratricopeptide (TPR) repeat protein
MTIDTTSDKLQLDYANASRDALVSGDFRLGIDSSRQMRQQALQSGPDDLVAIVSWAYTRLCMIYGALNYRQQSIHAAEKSIEYAEQCSADYVKFAVYQNFGKTLRWEIETLVKMGQMPKAIQQRGKAIEILMKAEHFAFGKALRLQYVYRNRVALNSALRDAENLRLDLDRYASLITPLKIGTHPLDLTIGRAFLYLLQGQDRQAEALLNDELNAFLAR